MHIPTENQKKEQLGAIYSAIAEKLNITQTQFDEAKTSYERVGTYLREKLGDDSTHLADVDVFPQGSMGLGTVVRPSDESDDFDVDLVCRLNDGMDYTNEYIKNSVGDALKEHEIYRKKIQEKGEGKRCWTIDYNQYHMDILPCVPYSLDMKDTRIRLTHKQPDGAYISKYSNPEGYRQWFLSNAKKRPDGMVLVCDSREFGELVKLPFYSLRLPLQKAIQILKRHRNIMFANAVNKDDAPISIIITTLMTEAYQGETNVFVLLESALQKLPGLIKGDEGEYRVMNPVMKDENFAEKWNSQPEKHTAFMQWLDRAWHDLVVKPKTLKLPELMKWLGECLGAKPANSAHEEILESQKHERECGKLVVNGCLGGLGLVSAVEGFAGTAVRAHTFYGK